MSDDDDDDDISYGTCERCDCNLTDASEALDGICDQCSWWLAQCHDEPEEPA